MATQLFYQLQAQTLAGAGCAIGDTSIILNSFTDIDGTTLVQMTDLGTKCWMTLEPNTSNEEQISFTGITQNANGTATITGVSHVAFKYPYTETSGVSKTHVGGSKAIVSNTSAFYNTLTSQVDDEVITGSWTFTISPNVPTPISASTTAAASVAYVNSVAIAGAPDAAVAVKGVTRLSTAPVTATIPIAVGDNDTRVSPVSLATLTSGKVTAWGGNDTSIALGGSNVFVTQTGFQKNAENYALSTGSSTAYVVTLSPAPVSLSTGQVVSFKAHTSSGTASTLNVNGLGAKSLVKMTSTGTSTLAIGDLGTSMVVVSEYNGNEFQIINPVANAPVAAQLYKSGTTTRDSSTASGNQTIAHGLGVTPRRISITANRNGVLQPAFSYGTYDGTTIANTYVVGSAGTGASGGVSSGNIITAVYNTSGSVQNTAVPTFDSTNITLAWTKSGADSGTINILWEAWY